MDAAQFTLLAVLVRVVFRRPPRGGHFGLRAPMDWGEAAACAVGVAGAVAFGWLAYGPGGLPFGASLVVAFVAGAACEWLARRWGDRAEPAVAADPAGESDAGVRSPPCGPSW